LNPEPHVVEDVLEVFEPWTESWQPSASPQTSPQLPGTAADFLRDQAIPEIEDAARRVQTRGHQLTVQDLLDLPDATLRVLFWPCPGRMAASTERTRVTLEFMVQHNETDETDETDQADETDEADEVVAVCWSGDPSSERVSLGHVPVETLDLGWVRSRVLDFIEIALAES
jgi:hypothetical protein